MSELDPTVPADLRESMRQRIAQLEAENQRLREAVEHAMEIGAARRQDADMDYVAANMFCKRMLAALNPNPTETP